MPNDNRKNQNQGQSRSKPDQRNGMQDPSREQQSGGNQQVSRDRDDQDRGKLGEQEGMDRQQQSSRSPAQTPDQSKGELGNEIDDEEDDLSAEDVEVEDDSRITQRNPSQRSPNDSGSAK